jgi:hypothetical protein
VEDDNAKKALIEDRNRRFKDLFESTVLSDEEKRSLSNEMRRIMFGSGDKVVK